MRVYLVRCRQHLTWNTHSPTKGAGGPQAPPLDPVDIKVEELLGEKNATVIGVIQNDLGFHTLRKLQTQQRQEDTEELGEEPPQQQLPMPQTPNPPNTNPHTPTTTNPTQTIAPSSSPPPYLEPLLQDDCLVHEFLGDQAHADTGVTQSQVVSCGVGFTKSHTATFAPQTNHLLG
ncbi:hypothetical protein O3P69_000928 [Scylla paramamosain]|uniref:Uncharacterized protein n=1 Tax=Scylla paramamosain TaxID=85552 RepID=A0AAW0UUZ0_SCYPA